MKSVCLILSLAGHMIPINKPFPSPDSCERAGFSMTDGQTVKGYACLPRFMVDGLPTYDCGAVTDIDLTPPPARCTFNIMNSDGAVTTISAPCDETPAGTVNSYPEDRTPPRKYQKRME